MESWKKIDRSDANDLESRESIAETGDTIGHWLNLLTDVLDDDTIPASQEVFSWAEDEPETTPSPRPEETTSEPAVPEETHRETEPPPPPTPPQEPKSSRGRLQELMSQHLNISLSWDFLQASKQNAAGGGRLQKLLASIDGQKNTDTTTESPKTSPSPPPPSNPNPLGTKISGKPVEKSPPEPPSPAPPSVPWEQMQTRLDEIDAQLKHLEGQIYEPTDLVDPLLPLINELLTQRVRETQAGICDMLVPIIDRVLLEKSQQDLESLGEALADVIPMAIAQEIENSPEQIASAIAPEVASAIKKQIRIDRDAIKDALGSEMGRAIKAQIELERDAMVDALYPVIGATISKYMGEAIREINAKVENALSIQGVERKIRAKIQGVSEAELIFRESMPCNVEAIFLIHKASGLIVAEVQKTGGERLESEMIAGMLTAIRSFANDCIAREGQTSELHEIEYSGSKIVLEVAGYCYLAVSIQGEPSKSFFAKMRQTLGTIVRKYDRHLEEFEGDPDSIPDPVRQHLEILMHSAEVENERKHSNSPPTTVLALGGLLLLGTTILGGWRLYERHIERRVQVALDSTPELAIYRIDARVRGRQLQLSGTLPDEFSRTLAQRVTEEALPQWEIDNSILAAKVPPNHTVTEAEVQRLVGFFNRIEGVDIWADYIDNQVRVRGTIESTSQADRLTQALDEIPGVDSVVTALQLQSWSQILSARIYFDKGIAYPTEAEAAKIVPIGQLLEQHRELKLKIVGHSDITGRRTANRSLAEQRANAVKNSLIARGIEPERLIAQGSIERPPGVSAEQPLALSRCVRFEPIQTTDRQTAGDNGNNI